MLHGPLHGLVRFVRYVKAPRRYCVSDAQTAIEPRRESIEARRRETEGREAAERAAAAARRAGKEAALKPPARRPALAMKPTPPPKRASTPPVSPEVFVRRASRA